MLETIALMFDGILHGDIEVALRKGFLQLLPDTQWMVQLTDFKASPLGSNELPHELFDDLDVKIPSATGIAEGEFVELVSHGERQYLTCSLGAPVPWGRLHTWATGFNLEGITTVTAIARFLAEVERYCSLRGHILMDSVRKSIVTDGAHDGVWWIDDVFGTFHFAGDSFEPTEPETPIFDRIERNSLLHLRPQWPYRVDGDPRMNDGLKASVDIHLNSGVKTFDLHRMIVAREESCWGTLHARL